MVLLSSRDQAWRSAKGRTTRRRVFSVSPSGSSLSLSARTSCAYASPKTPSATKRVSVCRLMFVCLSSVVTLKCMFSKGFDLPIVFCFDMTDHQHLNSFIPRSLEFPIICKKWRRSVSSCFQSRSSNPRADRSRLFVNDS